MGWKKNIVYVSLVLANSYGMFGDIAPNICCSTFAAETRLESDMVDWLSYQYVITFMNGFKILGVKRGREVIGFQTIDFPVERI